MLMISVDVIQNVPRTLPEHSQNILEIFLEHSRRRVLLKDAKNFPDNRLRDSEYFTYVRNSR
jgi:hypothetical protein